MSKRPVPPSDKRIIISARVTPRQRRELMQIGEGNISRGLDRCLTAIAGVREIPGFRAATPPAAGN